MVGQDACKTEYTRYSNRHGLLRPRDVWKAPYTSVKAHQEISSQNVPEVTRVSDDDRDLTGVSANVKNRRFAKKRERKY